MACNWYCLLNLQKFSNFIQKYNLFTKIKTNIEYKLSDKIESFKIKNNIIKI